MSSSIKQNAPAHLPFLDCSFVWFRSSFEKRTWSGFIFASLPQGFPCGWIHILNAFETPELATLEVTRGGELT